MALAIWDEIQNFGVKDALGLTAFLNQQKIDEGFSKSQNLVNELNAQAALLTLQAQAQAQAQAAAKAAGGSNKGLLIAGAVLVVAVLGYAVLKAK